MFGVEDIPDADMIGRHVYAPRMYSDIEELVWQFIFEFPNSQPESVAWEKYAEIPREMHAVGINRANEKTLKGAVCKYEGYLPAVTGDVRRIKTARGHGFSVVHHPVEGIFHAHLEYKKNVAANGAPFSKIDKGDLKEALRRHFGPLQAYSAEQ